MYGPWDYDVVEKTEVGVFITFAMLSLAAGFYGEMRRSTSRTVPDENEIDVNFYRFRVLAVVGVSLFAALALLDIGLDLLTGGARLGDVTNPGQIYADAISNNRYGSTDVSLLVQLKTILSPLSYLSNAFCIYYWSRLPWATKAIFIAGLVTGVFHGVILRGAQKGVFDVVIFVCCIILIRDGFDKHKLRRLALFAAILLIFAVAIFVFFQLSRLSVYNVLDYVGVAQMQLRTDSILFELFGSEVGLGLSLFLGYLSQGYYGLGLALQLPFEWTFGSGNSFALAGYLNQYFGVEGVLERTYPFRMEEVYGWSATMYWHTIFPWLASDIGFSGSIIFMYLVGLVWAKSILDSAVRGSPLALCIFYFCTTLVIFIPANNQLMQTREMFLSTVTLFVAWVVFGRRRRASGDAGHEA
jgi:hypothetical protein